LTGLPPSPADVEEFVRDDAPDAYARLVDRLLASPRYGEKMAQGWLDLARFGDSSGYQDDGDRPSWPYRDYVIRALNDGMPFDRFTIENLAGDLLPDATMEQQIASGFNRLHRHNEEGGSDEDEFRAVYTVDRVNTTAATWLGLTLGCAQCHDHKYDPITQREYYSLFAFFNSLDGEVVINKNNRECHPFIRVPTGDEQRQLDGMNAELAALEARRTELTPAADAAFATWLAAESQRLAAEPATADPDRGAIGGLFGRSEAAAYYADAALLEPLGLSHELRASGRINVPQTVNAEANVGYFSAALGPAQAQVGFSVAEGPRFFAYLGRPGGERVASEPLFAQHGVQYDWSFRYDPDGGDDDPADDDVAPEGLLTLDLRRGSERVGTVQLDLSAADRAASIECDAFGLSVRGTSDADTPVELYVDDLAYVVSRTGDLRLQDFSCEPDWKGDRNREQRHNFGFHPTATTAPSGGSIGLTAQQVLLVPEDRRTPEQVAIARSFFVENFQPELTAVERQLESIRNTRTTFEKRLPVALVWREMAEMRPARVLARGDYQQPGELVERNVPSVFPPLPDGDQRDRLSLARWLVSREHPLTSRVTANRIWQQLFGAGLVRTPEDFGARGELPTHPELLDWLAAQLMDGGWEIKRLQRAVLLSHTYRQTSSVSPEKWQADPENRLLARGARFRLTAEEVRDAALSASGLLVEQLGGESAYPYQNLEFYREKEDSPGEWQWPQEPGPQLYRRGMYTFWRRTTPYPPFTTFDAPSRGECTVMRSRTNTPLQALITLNDPTFVEAARVLAERIVAEGGGDAASRLECVFERCLSRPPSDAEAVILLGLYERERERYRSDPDAAAALVAQGSAGHVREGDAVETAAWIAVATALLNLDEAITRE
ncbi:MAG: DUF1553 domain-containing protein, partial [Planctomycetaceae bacterium]|nr:DUF1553 domain-containing protein [Planctomycetaceae bacterium]